MTLQTRLLSVAVVRRESRLRSRLARLVLLVGAVGFAGCGGGGGASAPSGPGPAPAPTAPVVTSQPQPQNPGAGTPATFTVTSLNAASYQWQRSTDSGASWSDIAGASTASLTVAAPALVDTGHQFRVVLGNAQGATTSAAAALIVRPNLRLLAGAIGGEGHFDASGAEARFGAPRGVAFDAAGNSYVADGGNDVIRKITTAGVVSTFAGVAGQPGRADGPAASARFDWPRSLAVDSSGAVWVIDQGTCWLRRIANGQVSSVADLGFGVCASRSAGLTGAEPAEVAVGPSGDVFVSDRRQHVIRRIDATGAVTTFAGSVGVAGSADGQRAAALFRAPRGLAFDGGGNLYVADGGNQTIRRIASDGTVTTLAGTAGVGGHVDGIGPAARFAGPRGVAVAAAQRLLVSDTTSHTVRQVDLVSGAVTTLAGTPFTAGAADGTGAAARFDALLGIAANASVAYVADTNNHLIRRIDGNGTVTRVAGQPSTTGTSDGIGSAARFSWTNQIAADASGNIYMADIFNDAIRRISPAGSVTTFAGVAGQGGYADGTGSAARFFSPSHLAIGGDGNLYVADNGNCVVRRISPLGAVVTIAGTAGMCGFDDGLPGQAKLGFFAGLAAGANGALVFSQTGNCVLRGVSGVAVSIVAGNGTCDVVDGPQAIARVAAPAAMAFEANGDVVFVDRGPTVRRLRANGSVETIAGSLRGNADGGGTAARFENISALAVDANGRIYVTDTGNQSLRLIDVDRSVRTLIPLAAGPRVVLGTPGSLNKPVGLALLPGNVVALTSEQSVLLD